MLDMDTQNGFVISFSAPQSHSGVGLMPDFCKADPHPPCLVLIQNVWTMFYGGNQNHRDVDLYLG